MQVEGETIDQFVTDLRLKVRTCECDTLTESMIRDQIVNRSRDEQFRTRVSNEEAMDKIDLDTAIKLSKAAEASQIQLKEFTGCLPNKCMWSDGSLDPLPRIMFHKEPVQEPSQGESSYNPQKAL